MSPANNQRSLISSRTEVLTNELIAKDTYLMRLRSPQMAERIKPGQFVMIRLPGRTDPLLARPFALYDIFLDAEQRAAGIDFVYLVIGKLTGLLAGLRAGDEVELFGPLGNGFPDIRAGHVGFVAGGIGFTPFLAYARDLLGLRGYGRRQREKKVDHVSVFLGARTGDFIAGVDDLKSTGADVHLATDDGSVGHHGYITDLLAKHDMPHHLVGCGPEPMMQQLAKIASTKSVPCHLSLETPMACGVGICFSCVTRVRTDEHWDYARVCVDGPVFDASRLIWDD